MAAGGDYSPPESFTGDDDDSEGWCENDIENEFPLTCLFCPQIFKTMAVALEHCKSEHDFDLIALKKKFLMDCYSYICLVNYVRKEGALPSELKICKTPIWSNEAYLAPVLPEDPWLMFDFEGLESPMYSRAVSPNRFEVVKSQDGMVTLSDECYCYMQQIIKQLTTQVDEQNTALALAAEQMQVMRSATQKLMDSCDDELEKSVGRIKINEDDSYFQSYSNVDIHFTMLMDKPRTLSYKNALLNNTDSIKGKTVLDIGCGSGILSMFAVKSGAAQVIGVDQSEVVYQAMDIIRENGLEKDIEIIRGLIEKVELPVEKVDVIVSEWMGYFLLFEGMLDSVIFARDKFLSPGGLMLPSRSTITLVGLSDIDSYQQTIKVWSDIYGFKMSTFRTSCLQEVRVNDVNPKTIATSTSVVLDLNLNTCTVDSTNFQSDFILECTRTCTITSICGYFDVAFELPFPVTLSTGPLSESTHWKQAVFFLHQTIDVNQGDVLQGCIKCTRKSGENRSLVVELTIKGRTNTYYVC